MVYFLHPSLMFWSVVEWALQRTQNKVRKTQFKVKSKGELEDRQYKTYIEQSEEEINKLVELNSKLGVIIFLLSRLYSTSSVYWLQPDRLHSEWKVYEPTNIILPVHILQTMQAKILKRHIQTDPV